MTESTAGLRRVLGPVDATCIVVGAIVGVGIFFTPSRVATLAGSESVALLAWAVGGLIALAGALTFAELGGLYPRTGGQYQILRDSYGPAPAFLFVFCNATAIQAGAGAIIAIVCAQHLGLAVTGQAPAPGMVQLLAALLIVALVGANAWGVRWGSGIQNATVFAKIGALAAVGAMAILIGPGTPPPATTAATDPGAFGLVAMIFAALVPAFFAFGGWQHALWIAGEVRDARRNVPTALIVGVGVVVAIYMLVNWAYLHLLGHGGVGTSQTLAADAVATMWPGAGPRAIAGAVAISAFGVLNAQFLSGPRLLHGMAADGRFFRIFAWVDPRHATPIPAIALIGGLALVMLFAAGAGAIDRLLTGVVFIDGIFFALTGVALLVLRRRRANAARPIRVPLYPVIPLFFIAGEVAIVVGAYVDPTVRRAAVIGLVWMGVGLGVYWGWFRRPVADAHPDADPDPGPRSRSRSRTRTRNTDADADAKST